MISPITKVNRWFFTLKQCFELVLNWYYLTGVYYFSYLPIRKIPENSLFPHCKVRIAPPTLKDLDQTRQQIDCIPQESYKQHLTKTSNQPISTLLHFHIEIVFISKSLHCFSYSEREINGLSIFNGVVSLFLTLNFFFCLTKEVAKAADPSSLERCKCNSCQREFFFLNLSERQKTAVKGLH